MRKQVKQIKLVVKDGVIHAIYDDALIALFGKAETVDIKRASHVEPDAGGWGWIADMTPVNGPVLTNFKTRKEALDAEVQYLNRHVVI
jgi:hypothetical protein